MLISLMSALLWLVSSSLLWERSRWSNLDFNELLNQLLTPVEGTGSVIIKEFLFYCLIPAVLIGAGVFFCLKYKLKIERAVKNKVLIALAAVFLLVCILGLSSLDFWAYIKGKSSLSSFIEDNYVSADDVRINFPEKKRNLIFIWLESMEVTFTDEESGGAFSDNALPCLTKLALENECFSGKSTKLNGAYSLNGSTWTAGALFAYITGLPLDIPIAGSSMDDQDSFFPGADAIGDVLAQNGYRQGYLIGSEADFGGRSNLFKTHGDYEIWDYNYSIDKGEIDPDYYVWWGYEDKKLFDFAKKHLLEMAEDESVPFNLSILTVDTHFPDGYVCDDCEKLSDSQYYNVIRCSDKQVAEFIEWIKEQDFYENTTIILGGDHPTMDTQYCKGIRTGYDRKVYINIINGDAENKMPDEERVYSTFDLYPTAIAALGAEIEGDRLGLGTNLYSKQKTIIEKYGYDYVQEELAKASPFLKTLSGIDETVYEMSEKYRAMELNPSSVQDEKTITFTLYGLDAIEENVSEFDIYADVMHGETRSSIASAVAQRQEDGSYTAVFYKSELIKNPQFTLNTFAQTKDGRIQVSAGYMIELELGDGSLVKFCKIIPFVD